MVSMMAGCLGSRLSERPHEQRTAHTFARGRKSVLKSASGMVASLYCTNPNCGFCQTSRSKSQCVFLTGTHAGELHHNLPSIQLKHMYAKTSYEVCGINPKNNMASISAPAWKNIIYKQTRRTKDSSLDTQLGFVKRILQKRLQSTCCKQPAIHAAVCHAARCSPECMPDGVFHLSGMLHPTRVQQPPISKFCFTCSIRKRMVALLLQHQMHRGPSSLLYPDASA